jgi:hypothetical protein
VAMAAMIDQLIVLLIFGCEISLFPRKKRNFVVLFFELQKNYLELSILMRIFAAK